MDRFTQLTTREETATREQPYSCWECGDACDELTQAPWTGQRLLVGPCCLPTEPYQPENTVTPEEAAALVAEEEAIFGMNYRAIAVNAIRKQASQVVADQKREVA
jgi:hypothetical protein